jgi:hypothetical protein
MPLEREQHYVRDRAYVLPPPFNPSGTLTLGPSELQGRLKECLESARQYLRLQPAYPFIQDGLDMINGYRPTINVASLSDLQMELTIRNLKELNAAQTNLRIIPAFKTDIPEFNGQNAIMNKCFMAWQQMTFQDRSLRKCWQYATGAGTGYAYVRYDPNYYYKGRGDLVTEPLGPLDVLPVGLPRTHDIQKAYLVALRIETPFHEVCRLYPTFADKIRPSRESATARGTVMAESVRYASAALRRFGPGASQEYEPVTWPALDLYYVFIDDWSVNNTGHPVPMGRPGTSWYYEVPYIGQLMPDGNRATEEDCLYYPTRRRVVMTEDIALTPDPMDQVNPYWHSKVPITQFQADDWAWNFLGFPLTRAGSSYEKANTEVMRGVVDACNVRLNPPMSYDRNAMSMALAQSINTRIPGTRVGLDMTFSGDQMKVLNNTLEMYTFPPYIPDVVKANEARLTYQMGVADAQALARARQLPSSDSMDRILDSLGPLIKDQSRNMEQSIRAWGEQWKSNFFQFMPAKRRMELIGPDGMDWADFDFEPGDLIPAGDFNWQTPEATNVNTGEVTKWGPVQQGNILKIYARENPILAKAPKYQRARWHKDQFTFTVTPYSIHEMNSMTRRMFHLQLMRSGFPLDWWTLAELFDIKNFGPPPRFKDPETGEWRTANTVMERYTVQLEIQARIAQATGAGQQGKGKGHPPSGQKPPTLSAKTRGAGAGTDAVVRESKQ